MHILLTDVLRCPRCGPDFGLVLLADRVDDRRVLEGRLGCANCREAYPVRRGEVDLRIPGAEGPAPAEGEAPDPEAAVRVAALLGLTEGRGSVLLVGGGADLAKGIASLVEGVEVVTLSAALRGGEEEDGVNRVAGGAPLPFAPGSLRGVALTGGAAGLLDEAVRVLAAPGRLLVEGAPGGTAARLEERGLRVLLEQEGIVVAERPSGALRGR